MACAREATEVGSVSEYQVPGEQDDLAGDFFEGDDDGAVLASIVGAVWE